MAEEKYCVCCDQLVPFSVIETDEKREERCAYCGFQLDVRKRQPATVNPGLNYTLIAEDSKYTRKMIEEILKEKCYSGHIASFENGAQLVAAYLKLVAEKKKVDVAVIDMNMPTMDGIKTAMTLRMLEAEKNLPNVSIIFFSAVQADEDLKRKLQELTPAVYLNKSSDPDPDKLAMRIEELVSFVLADQERK